MHDDGSLMYDGGDCNLNHMANYIRVYFNSMRNSLEGGPDRAQSPLNINNRDLSRQPNTSPQALHVCAVVATFFLETYPEILTLQTSQNASHSIIGVFML